MTLLFSELFFGKWRKVTIPLIIAAGILAFLFFPRELADSGLQISNQSLDITDSTNSVKPIERSEQPIVEKTSIIMVDVKGAVQHPNVYSFEEGQRFIDAVTAAGGYTVEADSSLLNHAQLLVDGTVIYVPAKGEEIPDAFLQGPEQSIHEIEQNNKVNINTADESMLITLSGIGPSKAAAIITYREENGAFQTIEDVMNVSGIGQKTFDSLSDFITVN